MDKLMTLPITKAREKIFELSTQIARGGTPVTLTEHGVPKVVMMSADEFESWAETLEVMRAFPQLEEDIKEARKDKRRDRTASLEKILAQEGFVLADKPKRGYVPSCSQPKSRKRSKKS